MTSHPGRTATPSRPRSRRLPRTRRRNRRAGLRRPLPPTRILFPEEESKKAEKDAEAGERNGDAGPAKDSNGGAPESSSRTGLDKLDLLGDHDSRISNGAGGFIHDPQLAKTDINAGQFYMGFWQLRRRVWPL